MFSKTLASNKMDKKYLFIIMLSLIVLLAIAWPTVRNYLRGYEANNCGRMQAIPIIRSEYFDRHRNALMIGLMNPGASPIEVKHTELSLAANNRDSVLAITVSNYGGRPLVVDPGDTILIPFPIGQGKASDKNEPYWGHVSFQLANQPDHFTVSHQFKNGWQNERQK